MALDTNQVHAWHFNESSGNAADSVGSQTLTNNNTVPFGSGLLANCAIPVAASSESFSSTAGLFPSSPTAVSVNCWIQVRVAPVDAANYIISNDGTTSNRGLRFFYQDTAGSKQVRVLVSYNSDGSSISAVKTGTLTLDTWYMVTFTDNGTDVIVYVNGSAGTTASNAGTRSYDNSVSDVFAVAAPYGLSDQFLDGKFDELGVWTRALSGAEITELYNAGAGLAYPYTVAGPTRANANFNLLGAGS